jgi:hypothetical protein
MDKLYHHTPIPKWFLGPCNRAGTITTKLKFAFAMKSARLGYVALHRPHEFKKISPLLEVPKLELD